MLYFGVICLIPEILDCLNYGVTGRAIKEKLITLNCWNPREWTSNSYKQVDDKPYGGGPGMVMMYEPLHQAIVQARSLMPSDCKTVYLSPQGMPIKQSNLNQIAQKKQALLLIAGRYEGIDERIIHHHVDEEWSLGDFVLSGGELAAAVLIDAITRLIPGALGHVDSAAQDSLMNGVFDHPHYTRPAVINALQVPPILLSGDHQEIARWRRRQALGKTWLNRPDLLQHVVLSPADQDLLDEFKSEHGDL